MMISLLYIYIYNKLNIMSYNSACIELLWSLLFNLYIHSLCASRRAELARGQRCWTVLYINDKVHSTNFFGKF